MLVAEHLSSDLEGFLQEWFGPGIVAQGLVQFSQVVEALSRVWVFVAQNLPPDLERFFVERFGLSVRARFLVQAAEQVQLRGGIGVLRATDTFCHFHSLFRDRDAFFIFSLLEQLVDLLI